MLKNYLKVAFRNFRRHRNYSFINIAGLAVGLASFLLISFYVLHELSYDRFHKNADNIYLVLRGENDVYMAPTSKLLAPALKTDLPEVIDSTCFSRIPGTEKLMVQYGDKFFEEDVTGKMIDPMAGLIETMGKLPPDQKLWFQMIIEPLNEGVSPDGGKKLLDKLTGRDKPPAEGEQPLEFRITPGEKRVIEALESNIGKNMFRTKLRLLYLGKRQGFSKAIISSFFGGIKQFADLNLNSFKPNDTSKTYSYCQYL